VRFRTYLVETGTPKQAARKQSNPLGAEVRFSYRTSNFRGAHLPLTWSLVKVRRDGTLGGVVAGQDRADAFTVTPDACSYTNGDDLFVRIPNARKRYLVVLELFRDRQDDDRAALTETAVFHG